MRTKGSTNKPKIIDPEISSSESTEEEIKRLSFAVDAEGRIIWDGMRSATRDKLKAVLSDPQTAKNLGLIDSAAPAVEVFDPEWTGSLYDALGKLESFLAGKIYKISPDICEQVFTYSDTEKAKLGPPTARVINKYASVWMVQFKDEIALAFLIVTITAVKLQMAMALQNMRGVTVVHPAPRQPPEPKAADIDPANLERSTGEQAQ